METGSTMIALVLVFSFIGPIMYLIIKQGRTEKKRMKRFQELARAHSMSPDVIESLPVLLLGLDSHSRKLLVTELLKEERSQCYDLQDLISCKLTSEELPQQPGKFNFISLGLRFKNGKDSSLVFYNEEDGVSTEPEYRFRTAEKWQKIISGK